MIRLSSFTSRRGTSINMQYHLKHDTRNEATITMTTVTRDLDKRCRTAKVAFRGLLSSVLMDVVMQLPGIRPEYGVCTGNDCICQRSRGGAKRKGVSRAALCVVARPLTR